MPWTDLPTTTPAEIADLAFVIGRWESGETSEQWTAVADGFWGVGFGPGGSYEIMRIDAADGKARFLGRPMGKSATPFTRPPSSAGAAPRTESTAAAVTFLNPEHDDPQRIRYTLKGKKLVAAIGPTEGPDAMTWKYRPAEVERATALEEADKAFAVDVASRGVEAWIDAFDATGHQWDDDENVAILPGDDMRAYMARILGGKLVWEPVTSGMAPSGDLGFTVGTWTWTGDEGKAGQGSYVTVWRKQPDGGWKIEYDGGDPS